MPRRAGLYVNTGATGAASKLLRIRRAFRSSPKRTISPAAESKRRTRSFRISLPIALLRCRERARARSLAEHLLVQSPSAGWILSASEIGGRTATHRDVRSGRSFQRHVSRSASICVSQHFRLLKSACKIIYNGCRHIRHRRASVLRQECARAGAHDGAVTAIDEAVLVHIRAEVGSVGRLATPVTRLQGVAHIHDAVAVGVA